MDERVETCQDLLNMINFDKNFLDKVNPGDKRWCFVYDQKQSGRATNVLAKILHDRRNCLSKTQERKDADSVL
jgi:hypothetical protein